MSLGCSWVHPQDCHLCSSYRSEESYQGGTTNDSIPTLPRDVCGVLVLQCSGLPVSCDKSGPFSFGDINQMLAPFHVRLMHCCPKTLAVDGKYLCHPQTNFTGLHATEGYFQHFDNGQVEVWNIGQVACLADSSEVTLFQLKPVSGVSKGSYFQHFDNGKVEVSNIGQVACLADSSEVTLFQLKPVSGVSNGSRSCRNGRRLQW